MATFNAPSLANQPPIGSVGNSQVMFGRMVLAAHADGSIFRFGVLPAGAKVFRVRQVNAALGASTAFKTHFAPIVGSTPTAADFCVDADTAAGGVTEYAGAPVDITSDCYVLGTLTGGAGTGAVDVVVEYEYVGLK